MCTTKSGGEQLRKSKNDGRFLNHRKSRPVRSESPYPVKSRPESRKGNHHLHSTVTLTDRMTQRSAGRSFTGDRGTLLRDYSWDVPSLLESPFESRQARIYF